LALAGAGADVLVSFGTAGGLAADLRPGALLVATGIVDAEGAWVLPGAAMVARELGARAVRLASVGAPVMDVAGKARAAARWSAAAVDMESVAVARAACTVGKPVLVVRAVADPAERRLPRLAARAVGADGRLRPAAIAVSLLRWPGDWPAVVRAGRDAAAARETLGRAAARLAILAGQGLLERLLDVPVEDVVGRPLPR
jgi:hypothetical protein